MRKKCLVLFVTLGLFVLAGFAQAADDAKSETDETETVTMEEVVVTATKTDEKRKDIPNSVIIKDSYDIKESPAKTLGEFLSNETGVDLRTYGNYGGAAEELQIRGMSSNGTQIFVNGLNVNSPSLSTADIGRIPLNSIERIEVVKGSGSLLYGSGAMGGTVNIITKRPERDKMDLKARAGYGSENTYEVSAEQGMFALGNFGYYLTATQRETDGFRDNSDLTHNDISGNLILDKGDILDISIYGDYIDREYGVPLVTPPGGTQPFVSNGVVIYNEESASLVNKGADKDSHLVLNIKSKPSDLLGIMLRGDLTNLENFNENHYSGLTGTKAWVRNKVIGTEGNIDIQPMEGAGLLLGAEYKGYDWEASQVNMNASGVEVPGSELISTKDIHTTGTYAEARYRPSDYVKFIGGLRHERHSIVDSENVYRLGIIGNPWKHTTLKANYGTHFATPSINDLFWLDDGFMKGNPNLKAENGYHYDITVEHAMTDNRLFFEFTYFNWDIKDKIRWEEDPSDPNILGFGGYWKPQNLDTYYGKGLEIGAKIGPFYSFELSLDYTYLNAEEEYIGGVRRQGLYKPEHLFKGTLSYWTDFDLTANMIIRYVGDRPGHYASKTATEPDYIHYSYWTMDLNFNQKLFDHWILTLEGTNLFDKEYDTYNEYFFAQSTFVTTRSPYPGAGRSVFFSVSYEY